MKDTEKKVKATEEVKEEVQTEEEGKELIDEELSQVTGGYNCYYGQTVRPVVD